MTSLLTVSSYMHAQDSLQADCKLKVEISTGHVKCKGGDDGTVILQLEHAVAPIFEWSNGEQNQDLILVSAGEYSVTVTDGDCRVTASVKVLEPNSNLTLETINIQDASCYGSNDGMITVEATGGSEPYLYRLEGLTDFQSGNEFNNLEAGEYTIYIQDMNGCEASTIVSVKEPAYLSLTIGSDLQIKSGDEITLEAGSDYDEYLWSTGETSSSITFSREVSSVTEEVVTLEVMDETGCRFLSNELRITIMPASDRVYEPGDTDD
jgi:hypothetical protein